MCVGMVFFIDICWWDKDPLDYTRYTYREKVTKIVVGNKIIQDGRMITDWTFSKEIYPNLYQFSKVYPTQKQMKRIYKNQPQAYIRTMDDDAGTMSSWFVMRSIGLSPANIGDPVYYLTAPIFKSVKINWENGKSFEMEVINYNKDHFYVQSAQLNGKELSRNWLTHEELTSGGNLIIETADTPNKDWGTQNTFITKVELN